VLAKPPDPHIKASPETIRKSLEGNWRPELLFTPRQSRQSYRNYQEQIAAWDEKIGKLPVAFQVTVHALDFAAVRSASPTDFSEQISRNRLTQGG
jgi:hypothetical protein